MNARKKRIQDVTKGMNEVVYTPNLDVLDVDVNETISSTHLGLSLVSSIDGVTGNNITKIAKDLIEKQTSRKDLIEKVLNELHGFSYDEFKKLGYYVGRHTTVKQEWKNILSSLYPTRIYAWSTSPLEVVEPFIKYQVKRFYHGKIILTATQPEVKDGVLTGRAKNIVDKKAREYLQNLRNSKEEESISEGKLSSFHPYNSVVL